MFRPLRAATALFALTLLTLTACADSGARRAAAPATTVAPAAAAPATTAAPKASPRPGTAAPSTGATDDQSLRLNGDTTAGGSCRQQCERSNNICMDSVAARVQSGVERPDAMNPFTPSDNCSYQLRTCYQRCNTAPR